MTVELVCKIITCLMKLQLIYSDVVVINTVLRLLSSLQHETVP